MELTPPLRRVAIVAGEASGDLHGAKLVAALKQRDGRLAFTGIGAAALREAGVDIVMDAAQLSVVGLTEVFTKLPAILRALRAMRRLLRGVRPDLLILIDFPDFNFRVAAEARRLGIPVLYYISPQIWAWRSGRVRQIRKLVGHMAVILPFEADFYRTHRVPVTFVGHPLLDDPLPPVSPGSWTPAGSGPVIGLLPGSRTGEVKRHLPVMLSAARLLQERYPSARFIVSRATSIDRGLFEAVYASNGWSNGDLTVAEGVDAVLAQSHAVVAASGTVTLQAALHGVPMVIIYKVSRMTYLLGRLLVQVRNIGLVNLVAGKDLAPELINADASPGNIVRAVDGILADPEAYAVLRRELAAVRSRLGGPGASERTAEIALGMLAAGRCGKSGQRD
jgi:lipid-A-disaccharide synthase